MASHTRARSTSNPQSRRARAHARSSAVVRFGLIVLTLLTGSVGARAQSRDRASPELSTERVKTGTGFFVTARGLLVTSAHVVSGCPALVVLDDRQARRAGEVVAANERLDIALIATHGPSAAYIAPSHRVAAVIGEPVIAQGFGVVPDDPNKPILARGTVAGDGVSPANDPVLVLHAKFHEGMSGGAVLNGAGSLLGMVLGFYTDRPELGVALPKDTIGWFLQNNGVALPPPTPIEPRQPTEVLKSVTSLIQCLPSSSPEAKPR